MRRDLFYDRGEQSAGLRAQPACKGGRSALLGLSRLDGQHRSGLEHVVGYLPLVHRTALPFAVVCVPGADLLNLARGRQSLVIGSRRTFQLSAENGEAMFRHACAMGLEGIVSKKVTSRYKVRLVQELAEGEEPCI